MAFTVQQKLIIANTTQRCIDDLQRVIKKTTARKKQFAASNIITGTEQTDMTKLTKKELKTKIIVLNKLHSEIINIESALLFQMQKVDKEMMKR